ncbi:GGDEF domain-containing protein [Methylophaga sp. OBS3]|uniref:GGDEF domain-containing protein n=1 Tax=Methylophaga sp. OBS3 TaxID=2991934 RepID=UPI00224DC010|nr:GGDEF domain-containing protein [Methylophaga sp. OBS3]MCX4189321.1 GGDEF domain-containing protein [Methylophaga sp. OBS3]
MDYTEYEERTAEYMRLAISMMKKHGIATTPANYAVWYEYVSGNNANLMDALDAELAETGRLTEQQSRDLYERFFDREKDRHALFEMRQEMGRLLKQVLNFVYTGVNSTDKSNHQLNSMLARLQPDMSKQQLHDLVEEILIETRLIVSAGELLSERLNTAVTEVEVLKKQLDETRREAKKDTLTGLANRKAFDDAVSKACADADATGMDLSLIFCDLDMFSALNEKHGQLVGDLVLRVVADTLRGSLKGRDLVARYGGEEFAILLMNTSLQNARAIADTLRNEISGKRIQRKDTHEPLGVITMSFGVARYVAGEGVDSFMQRSDRALYMAKRQGRNNVSEAPPPII